jgi:hypothetical protein
MWLWLPLLLMPAIGAVLVVVVYSRPMPELLDSRFVTTTLAKGGLPANASLKDRLLTRLFELQQNFRRRHPSPMAYIRFQPARRTAVRFMVC